jgi:hypothetical protein
MKKSLTVLFSLVILLAPVLSFAAANNACDTAATGTLQNIICIIGDVFNTLIPILVVAGVALFILGVVQYVIANEEEAKKKGRNRMLWGIVGLVVIISMWGIVAVLTKTLDLDGKNVSVPIPCVPGTPNCAK